VLESLFESGSSFGHQFLVFGDLLGLEGHSGSLHCPHEGYH
jgi:hypothetical protein